MDERRQRFDFLDALRGVAALSVVVGHSTLAYSGKTLNPYMEISVPFFFSLSGFVLLHAYRHRLSTTMSFGQFFIDRMIRLLPMVALAGALCLMYLTVMYPVSADLQRAGYLPLVFSVTSTFTTLPSPFLTIDNWRWPLNHPLWSLFAEFIASAALGLYLFKSSCWVNWTLTAGCFLAVAVLSIHTGVLAPGLTGQMLLVFSSFTLGVEIRRTYSFTRRPLVTGYLAALLFTLIVVLPVSASVYLMLVLIGTIVPIILVASSHIELSGFWRKAGELCGRLSFPIYVCHWPIMLLLFHLFEFKLEVYFVLSVVLTSVAFSFVAEVFYDTPVRRALHRAVASGSLRVQAG